MKVFTPLMQKQTKVMSFDDVTDITLMYIGGRYKNKHVQDLGELEFNSVIHSFSPFIWLVPQVVIQEATDNVTWLLWCFLRSGIITDREVFFICSTICTEGYHGYLELVCLSCVYARRVACHPVTIRPCIRVAKTAALGS